MAQDTFLNAKQAYNAVTRRTKDETDAQLLQLKQKINTAIEKLQYSCIFEGNLLPSTKNMLQLNGYRIYIVEEGYEINWSNPK